MNALPFFAAATTLVFLGGCKPAKSAAPKAAPAVLLSKKIAESDLAIVTLTPEAERRLGVETVPAAIQKVDLTRSYAGDLIVPLGRGGGAGHAKSIYALLPSMSSADLVHAAQAQIDAEGQMAAAKIQLEGAQLALKRAEELVANQAGIGRTADDARLQVQLAEAALQTAQERRALLGAPLFDAVSSKQLWVRVSVYVGELPQIKPDVLATIHLLGGSGGKAPALTATPVPVPFSAGASPAMTELYYEVKTDAGVPLRPGMKVGVSLPLQGTEESLVVPAAAILYDIHGNTWVYENVGLHAFTRRRVEVRRTAQDRAILARGPQPGAKIVTAGAVELFGSEFGAGK